jgi:hypothetical protein
VYVQNGIVKEEMIFEGRNGMKLMEKINYLEVEQDRKEKQEKIKAQDELSKKVIGIWSQQKSKEIDADASRFYTEDKGNIPGA